MRTSDDVVRQDLEYICSSLKGELGGMAGRRVFISGGAGFLGYYLVQVLLHWNSTNNSNPIAVTVCDNFIRGVPEWLGKVAEKNTTLRVLQHDITAPLPADAGSFDFFIHAASIASPAFYRQHPIETMDANVQGLRLLLDRARSQKENGEAPTGFLFFSSSEIYGDPPPDRIPTPETYWGNVSCTGPRACYDESKRYGETLCVNFSRQYELPIKVARPFNNYGPGLKLTDRRVIPDFVTNLLSGHDLVLLSDGSPTRTFCYVADAIIGYYKILTRGRSGEAYNIGTESPEVSMLELAELLRDIAREQLGYKGQVIRKASADREYLTDNPQRRCPSIGKARSELGFEPGIAIEDGLRRTLLWYNSNRAGVHA
ncbi:MAG TPA: NAD-dependent epimerase/dehydratase family protein [Chthoniobacterales bacterium]|nr:NAD-dependent epimerase/dehydratase family protein [Chthoniobacterales bacterium]